MKILITGGAGFIGTNLVTALVARYHTITVLDSLSPQVHGNNPKWLNSRPQGIRFLHGDVRNRRSWAEALEGQDAVIHLAAETGTGQSMYEVDRYVDVNIRGTALLLDELSNNTHDVRRLVVASSRSIYGEGRYHCALHGDVFPLARMAADMVNGDFAVRCPTCGANVELLATCEDSKIHPSSLYGISKQSQEQIVTLIGRALGIPTIALRFQNVYGPGQSLNNPYTGILSIFSNRIKNRNEIVIFEDGKESRDFVFIDDVVAAMISAVELPDLDHSVLNIGSGVPTSVETVAKLLLAAYGSDVPVRVSGNFRVGDIRHNYADISQAALRIDYKVNMSFESGIRKFADWVNTQGVSLDKYEQSILEMEQRGLYK